MSVIHVDQLFRKICSNKNIIDIIIIIVAVVSTYVDFERISDIETEIRVQRNVFPKKIGFILQSSYQTKCHMLRSVTKFNLDFFLKFNLNMRLFKFRELIGKT